MTAMQTGTYARETDGSALLYHSREFYIDAAYALRTAGTWWRRVDDQGEREAVSAFLQGELLPGEYLEYNGPGSAYIIGGPA